MKRVINDVVEELRSNGVDVKLIAEARWIAGLDTMEVRKPAIVLVPVKFDDDIETEKEYTVTLGFLIHVNQDELNSTVMNDYYEYMLDIYNKFMYKLRRYANSDEQQILKDITVDVIEVPDDLVQGYPMTGVAATISITKQETALCF